MKSHAFTMTAAALGLATMTNAATWTVGPGSSYDFPLIQQAIYASASGDTIDVYPSVYVENLDLLGKDLHIRSASGLGSVLIDGGAAGPVVSCVNGETSATVLEGLALTNGASMSGGGLLISASSPTVLSCHIYDNLATNGAGASVYKSSSIFQFCLFESNRARAHGGHLDLRGGNPQVLDSQFRDGQAGAGFLVGFGGAVHGRKTDALLTRCSITDNRATRSGGGAYFHDSKIIVEQSNVDRNEANDGGGIFSMHCDLRLLGVTSHENLAHYNGGAVYNAGNGDVFMYNCAFERNRAVDNGGGILVRKRSGRHDVLYSQVNLNLAGDRGAGICYFMTDIAVLLDSRLHGNVAMNGGGMFTASPNMIDIERTNFEQNEAQQDGGGLYASHTDIALLQCTYVGNAAGMSGGAMKIEHSRMGCARMVFHNNTAVDLGGALYLTDHGTVKMIHSSLDGNAAGVGGAMLNEFNSRLSLTDCKAKSNIAWSSAAPAGGLSTDSSSSSRIHNSIFCNNTSMNILGPWVDLGGNVIAASCP